MGIDLSKFSYELPEAAIAQQPLEDRAASRMLVLDRKRGSWEDHQFREFPSYLKSGDCLVLNNSKVIPSRLYGERRGANQSGRVEVLLLGPAGDSSQTWQALVRPARKMKTGERIRFANDLEAEIVGRGEFGERTLRFDTQEDVLKQLDRIGHVPLPPYIRREDTAQDRERYQTVFAREPGSAAAPTAGLHFTREVVEACRAAGATIAEVTLHVGLGTFQPIHGDTLHCERFKVKEASERKIREAGRVVCVGTTSVRAVESQMLGKTGETGLFIQPGFEFRATGAMLTNFHLPQSSLLMLVCAFAGTDFVLAAYRRALEAGYRFYSYGDAMLIV